MPVSPSSANEKNQQKKRGCGLRFVAAVVVLLALAGFLTYHFTYHRQEGAGCTVKGTGDTLDLEPDQAANAATIAAVSLSRALSERALTIALATAMQESRLENLDHGDRDSLGLFQQRPSQGWGTAQQVQDPVYATNAFFDRLVKIHDYTRLPLTVAAQDVQRSGFPDAYADHEEDATLLSAALTGRRGGALSCTTGGSKPYSAGGQLGDTAKVTALLKRQFGGQAQPRADSSPRTVAVRAVATAAAGAGTKAAATRRGWQVAQWAVAHAHDLKVERVAFGAYAWQAAKSGKGWQKVHSAGTDVRITVAR